jgi:hypothetical protein
MEFDILKVINNKVPVHTKTCFITGIVVGWITHFYMLSHKLMNWDDANNLNTYGSGDYLGRWFLKYIHQLGSKYSIPAVHGFLLILLLSLSACLVLEIAGIKSRTGAVLVPTLMLTFPSVVSTMTFMFMAHTSGIGIFMVCVAVYVMRKYKHGWIPAIVLLICVLGTYQSYISFAITLMLLGMISDLVDGKKFPDMLKKGILCVIVLGVSVLIYMKLSHIIYPDIDNETYGGVGNMGQIAISEMPTLIGRCYKRFLEYFLWKPFAFVTKTAQVANIVTCILAVALFAIVSVQRKLYRDILSYILLCVVCFFVPLGAAFIYFMAPEVDYSMLMLYAYVLVYVIVLALLERCMYDWNNEALMVKWKQIIAKGLVIVTAITMFVAGYTDYLLTNKAYLRTDIATQRVKEYFSRVISMAESTEGFGSDDRIVLLGEFNYVDNPCSIEIDAFESDDLRQLSGVALENGILTSGVRDNFMKIYLGYETADISWDERDEIMASEQYSNMPVYPATGCVQKINGIWVVKLCD